MSLALLFHHLLLNMFRMLVHPSFSQVTYSNPRPQKYTLALHSICSAYIVAISARIRVKTRAIARYFRTHRQKRISLLYHI